MKRWVAVAAGVAIGVSAPAATRDWRAVATPAAQGSFTIGNPKARVKLTEYVSYTCPHCRHFEEEAEAGLGAMVRSGSVSVEVRSAVHDKLDLVAALLARCSGPMVFPKLHRALFAGQEAWVTQGVAYDTGNAASLALMSSEARLRALADGSGLTGIARASGMSAGAVDRCFADPAALKRTLDVGNSVNAAVRGTPGFAVNGTMVEGIHWAALEPALRAAGAK